MWLILQVLNEQDFCGDLISQIQIVYNVYNSSNARFAGIYSRICALCESKSLAESPFIVFTSCKICQQFCIRLSTVLQEV